MLYNDSESETSDNSSIMYMSDDSTQCLIEAMEIQINNLKHEIKQLNITNDKLLVKIKTFQSIIKSDILEQKYAVICNHNFSNKNKNIK